MNGFWWRGAWVLACLVMLAAAAQAQSTRDMRRFLQTEVNEVALLSAQAADLQQHGDVAGAATLTSYIPDHQVMIAQWSSLLQQRNSDPNTIRPNLTARQMDRLGYLEHDIDQHTRGMNDYARLARDTRDTNIRHLALLGQAGAANHLLSLRVARGTTIGTPEAIGEATVSALALEQATIASLQANAAQSTALGDPQTAQLLQGMISCHQQQAANLDALARQLNADRRAVLPPVVTFTTLPEIRNHLAVHAVQLNNTYALASQSLPVGPLQQVMANGHQLAFNGLAMLPPSGITTTSAFAPGMTGTQPFVLGTMSTTGQPNTTVITPPAADTTTTTTTTTTTQPTY